MSIVSQLCAIACMVFFLSCAGGRSKEAAIPATGVSIVTPPASTSVLTGHTATFSVAADGSGPLSYQWRKNDTTISGATSASYTTPAVTSSDSGATFSVVVTNAVSSVTSGAALLTVTPASTGSLQVTIKGLPVGVSAQAVLTGPGSYSQTFRASLLQAGLPVGTYTLTASDVESYRMTPATQTITIVKGKTSFAYVIYAPTLANVRDVAYGAVGDGKTDDTDAIQRAVDDMSAVGGIVFVPNGVYLIRADGVPSSLLWSSNAGIYLRSNLTFSMEVGASLEAIPTPSAAYAILYAESKSNINILGGTLVGDRLAHIGTSGQYGHGLDLNHKNENVLVYGVTAKNCWGDGFCLDSVHPSKNITFDHVIADSNRRQGLSITNADGVIVRNSIFKNTGGTEPQSGIDLEPEAQQSKYQPPEYLPMMVKNVLISNCIFENNAGAGVLIPDNKGSVDPAVINVTIDGNTFNNNGTPNGSHSGIDVNKGYNHKLTNNIIQNSKVSGINIGPKVSNSMISSNTISGSGSHGVMLGNCQGITVTQNTISVSTGDGIYNYITIDVIITTNSLTNNTYYGIQSHRRTGGEISGNTFLNNALGNMSED